MKILFFPLYYYMQYAPFKLIIRYLTGQGVDARLVYIPNISEADESASFNPRVFDEDRVPYTMFKLIRFTRPYPRLIQSAFQLMQFLINRWRLTRLLTAQKPDAVVISSHLGQVYIRLLQVLCFKTGIPVVSIWTIPARLDEQKHVPSTVSRLFGVHNVLEWDHYNRYMQRHVFLASGEDLKNYLIAIQGLPKEQVVVTGNPLHDDIYRQVRSLNPQQRLFLWEHLNFASSDRYIVLLSELIQDVAGQNYVARLIAGLHDLFEKLPQQIKVVVKYHPREPEIVQALYERCLPGTRYRFLQRQDLIPLLKFAELAVGHFTSALEIALVAGTPGLSIQMNADIRQSFFKDDKYRLLVASSPEHLERKITSILFDPDFRCGVQDVANAWVKENFGVFDGKNAARAANVIMSQANRNSSSSR